MKQWILVALGFCIFGVVMTNAATLTWDANLITNQAQDGSGTWDAVSTNWWDGVENTNWTSANPDQAVFGAGSGAAGTVTVSGTQTVGGITFAAPGSGSYTLSGGVLTLSGSPVISNTANATVNSVLAGSGVGFTKIGTGTLTVGGANVYGGGTTLSQGTLALNQTSAMGSGTITVGDGSSGTNSTELRFNVAITNGITVVDTGSSGTVTLGLRAGSAVNSDLRLNRTVVLNSDNTGANNRVFQGQITGPGAGASNDTIVIDSPAGNWVLLYPKAVGVSNTYTGNLRVKSGNLQLGNLSYVGGISQNLNIPDSASVMVDAGSTMMFVWGDEAFDALNGGGAITRNTGDSQGNRTMTIGSADGSGSFSGVIQSQINILKTGAGTQILSGANSYGGATTINGGVLQIGGGGATGTLPGNVTDNATLAFNRTNNVTYSGVISGNGRLVQAGSGTLILGGANTYSGGTTINAGTLQLGAGGPAGSVVGNITNNSALVFSRSDNTTYSGVVSGTGIVTKVGSGTLTLRGANTTASTLTVNGGAVALGAGGQWLGPVQVNSGATLAGAGTLSQPVVVSDGGGIYAGSATAGGTLSFVDVTLGNGTNVFNLYATNSIASNSLVSVTGNWSVSNAVIAINPLQLQLPTGDYPLFVYTNDWTGGGFSSNVVGNTARSVWALTNYNNCVYLQVTSYVGNLYWDPTISGNWDLLSSSNWLDGKVVKSQFFTGDKVTFDDDGAMNGSTVTVATAVAPSQMTVSNTVDYTFRGTGTIVCATGIQKTGTGALTLVDMPGLACAISMAGGTTCFTTVTTNWTYDLLLSGSGGNLRKAGAGMLTLGGNNSFSGNVVIDAGTLSLNHAGALNAGVHNGITLGASGSTGATLILNAANMALGALTVPAGVTNATIAMTQNVTTWSHSIVGATLASPLSVTQSGAGYPNWDQITWTAKINGNGGGPGNDTLIFNNTSGMQNYFTVGAGVSNDFSGNVHVKVGLIAVQSGSPSLNYMIPDAAMLILDSGSEWRWNTGGMVETLDGLSGSGTMGNPGSVVLTINASNSANDGKRVFSGSFGTLGGVLTKIGPGEQVFSGANAYGSGTVVSNGVLLVNNATGSGTGSGPVGVYGGTIGGTGTVGGVITVISGGSIAPGAPVSAIGTLKASTNVTIGAGGSLMVQLRTNGVCDKLVASGTVTISGATLSLSVPGDAIPLGTKYVILTASNIVGTFSGFPEGGGITVGSRRFVASYPGDTNMVLEAKSTGFSLMVQ